MRTWILVGSMAISESISPGIVFNNTLSYVLIGSFIVGILFWCSGNSSIYWQEIIIKRR